MSDIIINVPGWALSVPMLLAAVWLLGVALSCIGRGLRVERSILDETYVTAAKQTYDQWLDAEFKGDDEDDYPNVFIADRNA